MIRKIEPPEVSRRTMLIGGGLGVGLFLAWSVWPRSYRTNLRAAPGEALFNAFLKIGDDGRVIVAVPQAELGQGVYTSLPQIVADELGADWRTVSVEPAPLNPVYANQLLIDELAGEQLPSLLGGISRWIIREYATRTALVLTAGSSSVRAFEPRLREAGAAGRVLLSKAAARKWGTDWETLQTHDGFVWHDKERLGFGELAAEAADHELPETLPLRGGSEHRLTGQPVPRIDLPSKVDGSAQFAGDIRLPDMIYASVRQGPTGSRLVRVDREAADRVRGVISVLETPRWAAAVADNWWAANRAVEAMRPRFSGGQRGSSSDIERILTEALADGDAGHVVELGGGASIDQSAGSVRVEYAVGIAPNAPVETLTATARLTGNRLEIWAPTQAPGFARAAAARAAGLSEGRVTLYPTLVGGGYGRKLEVGAIEQAVAMAMTMKRPVQLVWSRIEETLHDGFRPPARARLEAQLAGNGTILGWKGRIAAPATLSLLTKRLRDAGGRADEFDAAAIDGALPPYQIPAVTIEHVRADVPVATGVWRSGAHSYTAFFTESFLDELARQARIEPLSYRMQMLGQNLRLARVLTTAASLGGWDGGASGSSLGIAAHSAFGSHAALLVDVEVDSSQRVRVRKAVCAVDCGRIINPEIVRQQIEGGIIFGIAGATGRPIAIERGLPTAIGFRDLGIPQLGQSPEVVVELIESDQPSGGVTELGVPPVAPAIANALFALTGQRLRSLPLIVGGA
jgi:isoquinoline 1-oxidoreductase subunit beta